jgi:hypothetical protein
MKLTSWTRRAACIGLYMGLSTYAVMELAALGLYRVSVALLVFVVSFGVVWMSGRRP